jgi:hypothetical protein
VGPSTWRPVAEELRSGGAEAAAADYGQLGVAPTYQDGGRQIAALASGPGWTLVVHSGAGGHAPSILVAMDRPAGVIFADAILPHPGRSWMETAPPALARRLRGLAVDGVLPPWNTWWDDDPLPAMLPDPALRAAVTAELPRVPLDWLETPAPVVEGWAPPLMSYLRLSPAYEPEAAEAAIRHWPVRRLGLTHLAMLTHPDKVAQELVSLVPG